MLDRKRLSRASIVLLALAVSTGIIFFTLRSEPHRNAVEVEAEAKQKAEAAARLKSAAEATKEAEAQPEAEAEDRRKAESARKERRAADTPPAVALPVVEKGALDTQLSKLMAGNVAFNTPERTKVGRQLAIQATLSTKLEKEELVLLVEEAGKVAVASLKVSDRMSATLFGGTAFEVSPSGPVEQWVSREEQTTWTWMVTPKTVGEHFLILTFDALITVNGKEGTRSIRTFKQRIEVDVRWPVTVGEWLDLIRRSFQDVSYLWTALLLPIGAAAWAWVKKRRKVAIGPPGNSAEIQGPLY
jgi:hypothetical protein